MGMVVRRSSILLPLALLAGCATAAQRQAETIKTTIAATQQQANACFDAVNSDPAYAEIGRHVPLNNVRQASLTQQTDKSYVTPHEVDLLSARRERLLPCRKALIDGFMVAPPIGVVWMDYYAKADANLLELAKRSVTWGDYVTRQKTLVDETQPRLVAAGQKLDAGLRAEHQQEMQQRAAAAQAFSNAMYQQQLLNQNQQMINNMNRPVMTNCNRFGNSVNCTSY